MAQNGTYAAHLMATYGHVVAARWGVTAREVANEMGLRKDRVLRLLRHLKSAGWVESDLTQVSIPGVRGRFIGSRDKNFRWRASPGKLLEFATPHWDVLEQAQRDRTGQ